MTAIIDFLSGVVGFIESMFRGFVTFFHLIHSVFSAVGSYGALFSIPIWLWCSGMIGFAVLARVLGREG